MLGPAPWRPPGQSAPTARLNFSCEELRRRNWIASRMRSACGASVQVLRKITDGLWRIRQLVNRMACARDDIAIAAPFWRYGTDWRNGETRVDPGSRDGSY